MLTHIEEVIWRRLQAVRVDTITAYTGSFFRFSEVAELSQWYRWYGIPGCEFMLLAKLQHREQSFLVTATFKRPKSIYLLVTGGHKGRREVVVVEITQDVKVKIVDENTFAKIAKLLADLLQQV